MRTAAIASITALLAAKVSSNGHGRTTMGTSAMTPSVARNGVDLSAPRNSFGDHADAHIAHAQNSTMGSSTRTARRKLARESASTTMRAALATINIKNAIDPGATATGNMATQRKHAASCARRATVATRRARCAMGASIRCMEFDSTLSIRKRREPSVHQLYYRTLGSRPGK